MKYTCIRCGKEFEAKHKTAVCPDCHTAVCIVCGKEFSLQTPWTQKTCSLKCRGIYRKTSGISKQVAEKAKQTIKDRYRVSNIQELQVFTKVCKWCGNEFKTTSARQIYCPDTHYGPCPVCGKLIEIKEMNLGPRACSEECRIKKINKTCLARYGNKDAVNSDHARNLSKQTCLNKYGVDHYSKSAEYRNKYSSTMLSRYGVKYPLQSSEILNKLQSTCEDKYGVAFNCMTDQCRTSYKTVSKVNQAFMDLLASSGISFEREYPIHRKSYDIKVDHMLIEINPTITHNSYMSIFPNSEPISPNYHLNKTQLARQNGYRCIHVWDWDDWTKIINLISPKQSVYARNCKVDKISKEVADAFTAMHHLSGKCNGQNINYGLYYDDELVEVMTFGKPRYNKKYDLELLRLCTCRGIEVIGGASKLFHAFCKDHKDVSIISYCDLSKFTGSVYEKIGMKLSHVTSPAKIWSKGSKKITDNLLRQRGYDQLFNAKYGKGTSNEQLMLEHGWLPVYDCGQAVYQYNSD